MYADCPTERVVEKEVEAPKNVPKSFNQLSVNMSKKDETSYENIETTYCSKFINLHVSNPKNTLLFVGSAVPLQVHVEKKVHVPVEVPKPRPLSDDTGVSW